MSRAALCLSLALAVVAFCGHSAAGAAVAASKAKRPLFCYWATWHNTRSDDDAKYCSHYLFSFLALKDNKLQLEESGHTEMIEYLLSKKTINPDIKVLVAVGGWAMGREPFEAVAKSAANIKAFTETSIEFLRKHNLDGLDIDWEYPQSKTQFVNLLTGLRQGFEAEAKASGKPRLLLTAAVSAGEGNIVVGYDIPAMSKPLDFVNLMSYDLHGSWEQMTGINAPLFASRQDKGWKVSLNVKWAVETFLNSGCPAEKLIMGMPLYGRGFRLQQNGGNPGLYAPTRGAASVGAEPGYDKICGWEKLGWTKRWEFEQQVPFMFKGTDWIGYDDKCSLEHKAEFLKEKNLAGGMVWELGLDDVQGNCGMGKYPLLKAIGDQLQNDNAPKPTCQGTGVTPDPDWTPPPPIETTPKPDGGGGGGSADGCKHCSKCPGKTIADVESKCDKFIQCNPNGVGGVTVSCPPGLKFNAKIQACDWPTNVNCS